MAATTIDKLSGWCLGRDDDNVYLVQELATEGDLYRKGGAAGSSRYNEHKVINSILVPMLSALQYLHERVGLIRQDFLGYPALLDRSALPQALNPRALPFPGGPLMTLRRPSKPHPFH